MANLAQQRQLATKMGLRGSLWTSSFRTQSQVHKFRFMSSVPSTFTKILCTTGPASDTDEKITDLIKSGARAFRLNFSHGDFESHERRLKTLRNVSERMKIQVAVVGDLQGPKLRVGKIPDGIGPASPSGGGSIHVDKGDVVVFSRNVQLALIRKEGQENVPVLPTTYPDLVNEVESGNKVLINDGAIRMKALGTDTTAGELRCEVEIGGVITSGKGINLPESHIKAPAITARDWDCVRWAVKNELDYLALSFVRTADEVQTLRMHLQRLQQEHNQSTPDACGNNQIRIISKIEKPHAVSNIEHIVEASDAIMVARGDLGVEMDIDAVPIIQKKIIEKCAMYGKPCIVATQMLETMIENPIPTRAEASDVANAIFDGADAVMLSAETATGKHPVRTVDTMTRIISSAEGYQMSFPRNAAPPTRLAAGDAMTAAMAHGAWIIAKDMKVRLVVCWSQYGNTARYLSQNNFNVPILAFTNVERSARQMALLNAVTPVVAQIPGSGSIIDFNSLINRVAVDLGIARFGDVALVVAGRPLGKLRATNSVSLHIVGSEVTSNLFN